MEVGSIEDIYEKANKTAHFLTNTYSIVAIRSACVCQCAQEELALLQHWLRLAGVCERICLPLSQSFILIYCAGCRRSLHCCSTG